MRTFIAVDLDPKIKATLSELISLLIRKEADVRWAKKQGMHITLKFLGEVQESQIPNIIHSIRNACGSLDKFSISLKGTGFFPSQSRFPRILWTGIEHSPGLTVLRQKIDDEFAKLGFPREKRQFIPHLTLGRVKSGKNISSVLDVLKDYEQTHFGEMLVRNITLFKSTLKPTGAEYDVLAGIELT